MEKLSAIAPWLSAAKLLLAVVLSRLLMLGQEQGLFQSLAPSDLSDAARQAWLEEAYRSWWAGTDHVAGHVVYSVLAVIAIFIILSFQVVGFLAVYVIVALHHLTSPGADWTNRDGRYGWSPLGATFRTVIWANALLAATLINVVVYLGAHNYKWILGLVVLYAIAMPLFVFVPWLVFRRVQDTVRRRRASRIADVIQAQGLDVNHHIAETATLLAEIERCHNVRIKPLSLRPVSWSTLTLFGALPIVLAAAQIFFNLRLGAQ
ncbi:hypothetical protein GCM10010531_37360 [Blastococcus jejuensis]|uniref:Uncharacterized protein n=2 Tax=Blastococcus jejuensis TaxID=351224 RepID=A0ABP6PIQ3_9ACTN